MWRSYWGFSRDPFSDREPAYLALPGHEEAVARLVDLVRSGQRWGLLSGCSGVGKTRVLRRAIAELRHPSRRLVLSSGLSDAASLWRKLACELGSRMPAEGSPGREWLALEHAVRVLALQDQHVILVMDDADCFLDSQGYSDLARLGRLGEAHGAWVTVLLASGDDLASERVSPPWIPLMHLKPLLLSESRQYLEEKLASSGCRDPLFSSRAVNRLHLFSRGVPRGLDSLASLCLRTAALKGQEAVSSELVDSLAGECSPLAPEAFAWMSPTA